MTKYQKATSIVMIVFLIWMGISSYMAVQGSEDQARNPETLHVADSAMAYADQTKTDAVTDSWIIKWRDGMPEAFRKESTILSEDREMGIVVAKPSDATEPGKWLDRWSGSREADYFQGNHKVKAEASPNDPLRHEQEYLRQIHAPEAWDMATSNRSIVIALVDTGVDLNHPDLKANLVKGINLVDQTKPPQDDNGHGTNVAGVIAAVGNNKIGTTGILWNAKIMPVKALEADGQGEEDKLGAGIRYAVDHGAKIIVLSVGLHRYTPYLRDVAQYAEDHQVLLISASGNDGGEVKYPAAYPTVLAVGGATAANRVEAKSNFGPEMDLVAPWVVYTTALGGGYKFNEGTSMAAPQVAAAAALVWAEHKDFRPYQIRSLLRQTAFDIGTKGWDKYAGYGLLRVDRALSAPYQADQYEPNNQRSAAKSLPLGTMISGEISATQDEDWFYLDAPFDGEIVLKVAETSGNTKRLSLTHYVPGRNEGAEYNAQQPILLKIRKGRSYVRIQSSKNRFERSLKYKLTSEFRIYRDHFEDNDKQYKAYALSLKTQSIVGTFDHTNDEDWFMFNVEQSGTLSLDVSTDTMRMDLALQLQKTGEKPYKADWGRDGESEYLPNEVVPEMNILPGRYYVRVSNENAENSAPVAGEYTLSLKYTPKYIDMNEPNNKPYQSLFISMDTNYFGVIGTTLDQDWFMFRMKTDRFVHMKLNKIPNHRVMSFALLDSNQKQISFKHNTLGQNQLAINQVLKAGTYYLRITADRPFSDQMYLLGITSEPLIAGFSDIRGHWAEESIVQLTHDKVVNGYGDYTFRPERPVTRAEAAAMIVKAFHYKKSKTLHYEDLSKKHWAYEEIAKATKAGIVKGYGDGRFAPNQHVSRVEMTVMIAGALHIKGSKKGKIPFRDIENDHWAAPIVKQMKKEGWISGYAGGTFRPDEFATRAEFISLLYRAINR